MPPFKGVAAPTRGLSLAAALLCACSDSGPRIYTARLYRRAGCLEPYAALGLVEASELAALCEPTCLRRDGGLYVSSVCAPYPARSSVEPPTSAECAAALAAFTRDVTCEPGDASVSDGSVTQASGGPAADDAAARPE